MEIIDLAWRAFAAAVAAGLESTPVFHACNVQDWDGARALLTVDDVRANVSANFRSYISRSSTSERANERGPDMFIRDTPLKREECDYAKGVTPLHIAAACGRADMVRFLLACGADPNARDAFGGFVPLHDAAIGGFVEIAETLIAAGAELDRALFFDRSGETPLNFAVAAAAAAAEPVALVLVRLLVEHGTDVSLGWPSGAARTRLSQSPAILSFIVALRCFPLLSRILRCAAGVEGGDGDGARASDAVALLLDHGAELTSDALFDAVRYGNDRVTRSLVFRGADVNARNEYAYTPLYFSKSGAISKFLIDHGADVDGNRAMLSPLTEAIYYNRMDVCEVLLAHGAYLGNDPHRVCPLHRAAEYGRVAAIALLAAHRANLETPGGSDRWTPLASAVRRGKTVSVDALVAHRADVTAIDAAGNTLLHHAVSDSTLTVDALKHLVCVIATEKGHAAVDVMARAKNRNGQTPVEFARGARLRLKLLDLFP